jgi:hypothetical protein
VQTAGALSTRICPPAPAGSFYPLPEAAGKPGRFLLPKTDFSLKAAPDWQSPLRTVCVSVLRAAFQTIHFILTLYANMIYYFQ